MRPRYELLITFIFCLILIGLVKIAESEEGLEQFARSRQEDLQAFERQRTAALRAFAEQEARALATFEAEIRKHWGDLLRVSQKEWVGYTDSLNVRTHVNFESGEVNIAVLTRERDTTVIRREVQKALARVVLSDGAKPLLAAQVQTHDNRPVGPVNLHSFAGSLTEKAQSDTLTGGDGQSRTRTHVSFHLVPDHIARRASQYRDLIVATAQRFHLDPALIFALVHVESAFNPRAISPAGALGLAQIMPATGREVYHHLYKQDRPLPRTYYFNEANNLELGCGYLALLRVREFKALETSEKMQMCIIAAYNTGPGNVSRALRGDRDLKAAVEGVQQMTSAALFDHLTRNLPYAETRDYLKKVLSKIPLYDVTRL